VFDECYGRMLDAKSRRDALDKAIIELAATPPYVDLVSRLVCLRGVSTLTAFAVTVELGDWNRFRPESLGPFLGLTPSEYSSGERRRQGAITKTGNSHVRRLLIEAAWHQRRPPRRSVTLERRRDGKPTPYKPKPSAAPGGCTHAGARSRLEASPARSSSSPSRASSPDTAGRWRR
jgi:transposase